MHSYIAPAVPVQAAVTQVGVQASVYKCCSVTLSIMFVLCRIRQMQGMRETQLTAEVELLPTSEAAKQKQAARPPISMNFEVCLIGLLL